LRRTLQGGPAHPAGPLRAGPLIVDPDRREAKVGGSDARLTAREFDVLVTLMRHPGRVLARKQILEEVWGVASDKTVRVVDTHVKWIRRKIGPAGRYIETLRGVGYRFTDQLSDQDAGGEPVPAPSRQMGCGEASVG
jgi:DNA-binding response OmpR family regulator